MEIILQHNIFEQPVECSVQACLGENRKHGSANRTKKDHKIQKQQTW